MKREVLVDGFGLRGVVEGVDGAGSLTEAFVRLVGEGRGATRQLSFLP